MSSRTRRTAKRRILGLTRSAHRTSGAAVGPPPVTTAARGTTTPARTGAVELPVPGSSPPPALAVRGGADAAGTLPSRGPLPRRNPGRGSPPPRGLDRDAPDAELIRRVASALARLPVAP